MTFDQIISIIQTIALIVAGAWTLYTFRALGQINRSRADLQKIELEQKKTEAEIGRLQREAKLGAVIEISITASQQSLPGNSSRYISTLVEIENKGNRNTRLAYDEGLEPFIVYEVKFKDKGALEYQELARYPVPIAKSPNEPSPSVIVRAGGREKLPFFFRVHSPGLYLLVFSARTSEEEQALAKELGFTFPGNWVAKEYFVVE